MQDKVKYEALRQTAQRSAERGKYRPMHFGSGITCPGCRETVDKAMELCPECGYRLHGTHCTYCGAPMAADEMFCGECGGNVKGTPCPQCGTLSFRSFCPNCNAAVDELGQQELAKAASDPQFQRLCALAQQILNHSQADHDAALSPEIAALLEQYRAMQYTTPSESAHTVAASAENDAAAITLSVEDDADFDIDEAIRDFNNMMASMVPDPGLPPQMQRNYYCARRPVLTKRRVPVAWVCNLCGCRHKAPGDCARPELGGQWIYEMRYEDEIN